jgi:predicted negative regulator of RcsB-dependent stress response
MKSERRHELKTNALARRLEGLPDYWREYGNKVMLVIIVFLIAYLAVRYYNDKKAREAQNVTDSLATIQSQLGTLDQLDRMYMQTDAANIADVRQKSTAAANDAINTLLSNSKDPKVLARAYIAQGDLDWKLANLPDPPGATTRPELKISNRDPLLNEAKSSYAKVLDAPYNQNALDVFTARMALAAIAENQGAWDEAKKQYQAVLDSTSFPVGFKDLAREHLDHLPEIQKAALLVPAPEIPPASSAATQSTQPAILGPEAPPMAQPANPTTTPTAVPTTGPAAMPSQSQPTTAP